jgi:ribonuclease BN (tRNA processing enzyme)
MKVIILGSGTCVPSLKRSAPAYYIEAEGVRVLVDCGSGALLQLEKAGQSYRDIDSVFITHSHPDHFSDLMPLVQALLATPGFRRRKDLTIFGTGRFLAYFGQALAAVLGQVKSYPLVLEEIQPAQTCGPFHISTAKTAHSSDSIAYRFERHGKSVVFTGDADYDQSLNEFAKGADLLITDCSFPEAQKVPGHMSARECGMTAHHAVVAKLVLSHIYPSRTPDRDRIAESSAVFSGDIVLAEDLMEFLL